MAHKLNAALKLGAHHVVGTCRHQICHLVRRSGAGDDAEARRPPSRLTRNNLGRRRTTPGNHQHPRPLKMRVLQNKGVCGIAHEHRQPVGLCLLRSRELALHH